MQLKLLAGAGPSSYDIQGSVINGVDFAEFVEGSKFYGDSETEAAGIFGAKWEGGELYITLAQPHGGVLYPGVVGNHWAESDWIDSESYIPDVCYIRCVSQGVPELIAAGKAKYVQLNGVWKVTGGYENA